VRGIVQVASRLTFITSCSLSGCQRSVALCSPAGIACYNKRHCVQLA